MISQSSNMNNGFHLFALKLGPQLLQSEWDLLFYTLPNEEQRRILNYKHWQDRQRALLGSVLVRWMVRRFTDVRYIQIGRHESGRPYLVGNPGWKGDFNLSHSGEWIVAALTHQGRVGVDVEKIDRLNEELMAYALSEAEIKMIRDKSETEQVTLFYKLWTMKEAIYKTGLFPNATPQSLDTVGLKYKHKDISTQLFYADGEHPVSICWNRNLPPPKLTILDRCPIV